MNRVIAILLFLFLSLPIFADDFICPDNSKINGETVPEAREAWCELFHNNKTLLHGPYRTWYPDNTLWVKGQYDKGVMVGQWFVWDKDGKLKSSDTYINGKKSYGAKSTAP